MAGKKLTELSSSIAPSMTGVTAVAYGGITYKSTLLTLRQTLVDSGSHYFTGSQYISGGLSLTGSLNVTGSVTFNNSITTNGYNILTSVTSSFVNDAAASAGGVPLQGLYRSGSFVLIRLT